MRSGYVNASSGTLRFAGVFGYGWSRIGRSDVRSAYNLYFDSSDVYPSNSNHRYNAFPVRCHISIMRKQCSYFQQNVPIHVKEANEVSLNRLERGGLRRGNTIIKLSTT